MENDVIKAGEEIKSLARFVATQRTAFRKLLKKYKKWTGSAELEDRFRDEVLSDPKSFTKLDLGPLLDDYSSTRQSLRDVYDHQIQTSAGGKKQAAFIPPATSSVKQLQEAVDTGSKVHFDTSIATTPVGKSGQFASYFVHQENLIELQMLLLQFSRFYQSRSRQSSQATPIASQPQSPGLARSETADYHMLVGDNLNRFAKEQSALTAADRERSLGTSPQRAEASIRWNETEDALACLKSRSGKLKTAYLKRKHVPDFFDLKAEFAAKSNESLADSADTVEELRKELLQDDVVPLFSYSSCRSRFVGLDDGAAGIVMATLDTGITIRGPNEQANSEASTFPFGLLLVRQEGKRGAELLNALDTSYIVERVRGFSLEYHSVWQVHQPRDIPAPFWLPLLSRDIRKLPPPPLVKRPSTGGDFSTGSTSSPTVGTGTDSSTAIESWNDVPAEDLSAPPLKSFRKKKRRQFPTEPEPQPQQKYWSEYDHPEDGDDAGGFYVYLDPNETNAFDRFFDRVSSIFRRTKKTEASSPLLHSSPAEDEESSDDEVDDPTTIKNKLKKKITDFGTFGARPTTSGSIVTLTGEPAPFLPQLSAICFASSLIILAVAYILHSTSRHKYLREAHVGVIFAIVCSLIFALIGILDFLRTGSNKRRRFGLAAWAVSVSVLVVDVVGSGGLLAWVLG